jgi:hypothetical protein
MKDSLERISSLGGSLRLVGYGDWPPTIPASLTNNVFMDHGLHFPSYFRLLSLANAIIPSFSIHKYLEDRASSTIPTSITVGTPVIAKKELIQNYDYLDSGVTWNQEDGESEIEAWIRVLELGPQEWMKKKALVIERRDTLIRENHANAMLYLEIMRKSMLQNNS